MISWPPHSVGLPSRYQLTKRNAFALEKRHRLLREATLWLIRVALHEEDDLREGRDVSTSLPYFVLGRPNAPCCYS